jgi:hypothetical protein
MILTITIIIIMVIMCWALIIPSQTQSYAALRERDRCRNVYVNYKPPQFTWNFKNVKNISKRILEDKKEEKDE